MEKLPLCIFGDGCLLRLTDQKHDETYKHTSSAIPACKTENCPLYRKAYDFIVGDQTRPTKEIKDAQRHASLNYHPPIRSKGVFKTRPRASSHIYPPERPPSVPKLDLEHLEGQEIKSQHAENLKRLEQRYKSPVRASTDPTREPQPKTRIFISPKRAENKDYMAFRTKIVDDIISLKADLFDLRQDITNIKKYLISRENK